MMQHALMKSWLTIGDWRMISADGQVITKAQALSALRSGMLRYDSVTFEEVEVRAYPEQQS
jgi:hypothetical protein